MRRTVLGVVGAAMAATLLVGCTGGDGAGSAVSSSASGAGYPVTIEHEYGSTTIPTRPMRIVSLATNGNGVVAALSMTAVMEKENVNSPSRRDSWLPEAAQKPQLLDTFRGIDIERVASLRPDLIIATDLQKSTSRDEYDKLSRIAPTLGRQQAGETATLFSIGEALGDRPAVQALIDSSDRRMAHTRQRYPALAGMPVAYGLISDNKIGVQLDRELATSVDFLNSLGLRSLPELVRLYAERKSLPGPPGTLGFSWEQAALLAPAELVLMSTYGAGMQERFEATAGYRSLPSVQKGNFNIVDIELVGALQAAGPYNTDWILQRLDPAFERAARR